METVHGFAVLHLLSKLNGFFIPSEVSERRKEEEEEKGVAIFEKLGCNITTERIESCLMISKTNPTVKSS